jgi:hypothetical protein
MSLSKNKPKTALLINNWDNPTSKAIIPKWLDFIALWNYEQRSQIAEINNIEFEKMIVLGSPTADVAYSRYNLKRAPKVPNFGSKLLYLGQQNKYDEISDLLEISKFIADEKTPYSRLFYRPHPLSQNKMKRIESNLHKLNRIEVCTCKNLNLNEFDGIISLPTTLILELVLSKVPAIIYLPLSKTFRRNPQVMWSYKHFDNFKQLGAIKTVSNFEHLKVLIKNGLPLQVTPPDDKFQKIFPKFDNSYLNRIQLLIEKILESTTS